MRTSSYLVDMNASPMDSFIGKRNMIRDFITSVVLRITKSCMASFELFMHACASGLLIWSIRPLHLGLELRRTPQHWVWEGILVAVVVGYTDSHRQGGGAVRAFKRSKLGGCLVRVGEVNVWVSCNTSHRLPHHQPVFSGSVDNNVLLE